MKETNFAARLAALKKECGIESKSRGSSNSMFSTVKKVLMEENGSREEAVYKILAELKEKDVNIQENYKKIMALIGNALTYARNPEKYSAFKGYKLVETEEKFQVIQDN
jgi:hypothetical protein